MSQINISETAGSRNGLALRLTVNNLVPPADGKYKREDIKHILEGMGVKSERVNYAMARMRITGEDMPTIMRDFNFLSSENVAKALAILNGLEFFPDKNIDLINSDFEAIKKDFRVYEGFVPVFFDGTHMLIAVSNAAKIAQAQTRFYEYKTKIVIASESTLQMTYRKFFAATEKVFDSLIEKYVKIQNSRDEDIESHPGLLRDIIGNLLRHAATQRGSDIHMHMTECVGLIKLTIDGISRIFRAIPSDLYARILSKLITDARVKIEDLRGSMKEGSVEFNENDAAVFKDVFERYGFRLQLGDAKGGFTAVIRLLDRNSNISELANLNFDAWTYKEIIRIINTADGLMLVTGPTGSGKTTSLYAMLKEIDPVSRSIQTIENPVEYRHGLWMQYEISRSAGGSEGDQWGIMLKGLLRNAPKIILMGEVRDRETAATLIEAANTGHLVFTTMHTNTAAMAVARLKKLEVDMDSLAGMLLGILAQRLTRALCSNCKIEDTRPETLEELTREDRDFLGEYKPFKLYRASERGCEKCKYEGYNGRKIVYELLVNSPKVRALIEKGSNTSELAVQGLKKGHSMWDCGLKLVAQGHTSMEALRLVAKEETVDKE